MAGRVVLEERNTASYARLAGVQGSGILLSRARADGLAVVPEEVNCLLAGLEIRVIDLS